MAALQRVHIHLQRGDWSRIQDIAKSRGVSASSLIRDLVEPWLEVQLLDTPHTFTGSTEAPSDSSSLVEEV